MEKNMIISTILLAGLALDKGVVAPAGSIVASARIKALGAERTFLG